MSRRSGFWLIVGALVAGTMSSLVACSGPSLTGSSADGAGATDGGGGPGSPLSGLVSLTITPPAAMLTVTDTSTPQTQAYAATGHFSTKQDRDVTAQVDWQIDNSHIGDIAAGVFTTSNTAGGQGTITATLGNLSATAQITVHLNPVISDPSAPAHAGTLLPPTATGTITAGNSPAAVYPSANTIFPPNMYKILFNFTGGTGNNLYRLEFKSAYLTLSVYTTSTSWTPNQQQWGYLANTNAGGSVTWTVYAVNQQSPAAVYQSNPVNLYIAQDPVNGAIYYWSTTVAGVRRATVSDSAPTDFLTQTQVGQCVACHTVSRNGARIGAVIGGMNLGVYNVKDLSAVIPPSTNIQMAWTTFNPDTSRIVTANNGVLTLRDGNTGTAIDVGGNKGVVPLAPKFGTMPDWSPDGTMLTFAYEPMGQDRGISGSSIATVQFSNDTFSNLKVIVPSTGMMNSNYYPTFSPDSKWIAYVTATGGNSDNNNAALLMIVPADGSSPPIALGQANTIVNNQVASGMMAQLSSTMPTWAPTEPGATMFLAFSSIRAYANVNKYNQYKQLWVTGIDPTKLPAQDPSYPAFWLPFQGTTDNSHRPYWVVDVLNPVTPPDGGTTQCIPTVGADCASGPCCAPNFCSPTNGGPPYTCEPVLG